MKQVVSVQWLRGLAAIMVIYWHEVLSLSPVLSAKHYQSLYLWAFGGNAGVDVFFIISGFIMAYVLRDGRLGPRDFIKKRIIRVVPTYWICTAFLLFTALLIPSLWAHTRPRTDLAYVAQSLFFWPMRDNDGFIHPLLVPGWTLCYEMFFYAALACALAATRKYAVSLASCMLAAIIVFGTIVPINNTLLRLVTDPLILEFIAGMLIAKAFISEAQIPRWVSASALIGAVLFWYAATLNQWVRVDVSNRTQIWGVAAVAFVGGAVFLGKSGHLPNWKLPERVGNWSYAAYLTHTLSQPALNKILFKVMSPENFMFAPLVVVLCVAISFVFYTLIEQPVIGLITRLSTAKPSTRQTQGV